MRNLKKILALVLALMMVLSVMVTASAASFSDDDSIAHKEAVEVMAAAGILNGIGDGSFNPTGTLDRASAAKLIAYYDLVTMIDMVTPTDTDFIDVKTNTTWASGYIAYVADSGYAVGDGTGNFNHKALLDGLSFSKMLLLAMGATDRMTTDPEAAPFTGNSWGIKVRVAIAEQFPNLLVGLSDVELSKPLSREHAAQMLFNALVYYAPAKLDAFGVACTATEYDAFRRPTANVWTKGEDVVYSEPAEAKVTYTSTVDAETIEAALEGYKLGGKKMDEALVKISSSRINNSLNGSNLGFGTNDDVANEVTVAEKLASFTGNGKLVEIYVDEITKTVTDIIRVEYTTSTYSVNESEGEDGKTVYTYTIAGGNTYAADKIELNGAKEGEVVTYVVAGEKAYVYATSTVEGILTRKNSVGSLLTIGEEQIAVGAAAATIYANYPITGEADAYAVDQYGYIVGFATEADDEEEPEAPTVITNYVYVKDIQVQAYVAPVEPTYDAFGNVTNALAVTAGKPAMAVATIVTVAGEELTVSLTVTAPDANKDGEVDGYYYNNGTEITVNETITVNAWQAYDEANGALVGLNSAYAQTRGVLQLTKGSSFSVLFSGTTNKYTTSATVVTGIFEKDDAYATDSYVGLPTDTSKLYVSAGAGNILVTTDPTSKIVTAIYVYGKAVTTVAPVDPVEEPTVYYYAFADAAGAEVLGGTEWTFYVNGETQTLVINGGDAYTKGAVYTLTENETDGEPNGTYSVAKVTMTATEAAVTLTDTTFFMVGGTALYYAEDCAIFNAETGAADVVEADDKVDYLVEDGKVVLVYVVGVVEAE